MAEITNNVLSFSILGASSIYKYARSNGYGGGYFRSSALYLLSMVSLALWICGEGIIAACFLPLMKTKNYENLEVPLMAKIVTFGLLLF